MFSIKTLLALGLFSISALALPTEPVMPRQSNGAVCGSNSYSIDDINNAISTGCNLFQSGSTVGRNHYPHAENNYENLPFLVGAPYLEFPIMADGSQFDGSVGPGPDRVVFDEASCALAGVVTHTGAGGNNFILCSYN